MLVGITKVTRQGQITLPAEVRRDFKIKIGQRLYVYEEPEKIIISQKALSEDELTKEAGMRWAQSIDDRLDAEDREIVRNGEDRLIGPKELK